MAVVWKLLVKDVGELGEWVESPMVQVSEPSVTILVLGGKAADNILSVAQSKEAQEALQQMDGNEVAFDVTAVVKDDDMIVASVDVPEDVPCGVDAPYMILWHSKRVKAEYAEKLLLADPDSVVDYMSYDPPVHLRGTVSLAPPSDDGPISEGALLKVETLPLPNKQAEPKGHATFVQEELADAWKAKLAASVKEDPPGPEGCKLKANVQAVGKPGHIYLRWGAAARDMTAKEIGDILEERLKELMAKA